jgi:hypothetical protein
MCGSIGGTVQRKIGPSTFSGNVPIDTMSAHFARRICKAVDPFNKRKRGLERTSASTHRENSEKVFRFPILHIDMLRDFSITPTSLHSDVALTKENKGYQKSCPLLYL